MHPPIRRIFVEKLHIIFYAAGTHSHGMSIFAKVERTFVFSFVFALFFKVFEVRIHYAAYVNAFVVIDLVFVLFRGKTYFRCRAFIVYKARSIAALYVFGHFSVIFAEMRFVSERPEYNGGAVFVPFKRACYSVEISREEIFVT